MKPLIPAWINFIFGLVGLIGVSSLGIFLAIIVEVINPQAPEAMLGPLLCPSGTALDIKYSRSPGGGVRDTRLECQDAVGQTVTTRSGHWQWLWYGMFMLPLLPLIYLIVLGLRRHNFPVQL